MGLFSPDSEFMQFLGRVTDFIIINLLTALLCLPLITAGAAFTARNYTAMKIIRGEEPNAVKSYFSSFKSNFRQVTILWVILGAVMGIMAYDWYLILWRRTVQLPMAGEIVLAIMTFVVWSVTYCLFYFVARFKGSAFQMLKGAAVMAFLSLPRMVIIFIVTFLPYLICMWYLQWGLAIWVLCTTVSLYYTARSFNKQMEAIVEKMEGETT